jgi:hypothetical protein
MRGDLPTGNFCGNMSAPAIGNTPTGNFAGDSPNRR